MPRLGWGHAPVVIAAVSKSNGRFNAAASALTLIICLGAFLGPFVVGLLDDHVFNDR
jgi:hypothetical protein